MCIRENLKSSAQFCSWAFLAKESLSRPMSFHTWSFPSRPSVLIQALKFLCAMLKMSSSCRTPMIGRSCSIILLISGSKAPLKKHREITNSRTSLSPSRSLQNIVRNQSAQFNILFMGKSVPNDCVLKTPASLTPTT